MAEVVLLDTGPLVAMVDRRDASHAWTLGQLQRLREPLQCCGAVLAEAGFVLRRTPLPLGRLRAEVQQGNMVPAPESAALWQRCFALMERYANVPMSFADACLVAMAEAMPAAKIFTLDRDFLLYRDGENHPLDLIAPFAV